ncbi:MAG: PQQ-binding-like beta-propeller repeat protein [Pirellula sp.]
MKNLPSLLRLIASLVISLGGVLSLCETCLAESPSSNSWERFRGHNGSGVLTECNVAIPWSQSQVQRVELPGSGHGSPVIYGGMAFLQSADPESADRHVVGIDLEKNSIAWKRGFPSKKHGLHKFSSYASSTPFVDDKSVYVLWAEPENVVVKAMTHTGEERWTRTLGRYVSQHGFGTSPIVVDGKLIFLNSQDALQLPPGVEPGQDRMIALDTESGKIVWETPLPTSQVCYGVPCVRTVNGKPELICSTTGQGMFAMDPSNGKILWSHDCFKQRVCASAYLVGDVLVSSQGSGGGKDNYLVALDINKKQELFRFKSGSPYVPTPVSKDGLLFLWSDAGIVSCVELLTGETVWKERIGGDHSSSPVIIGTKIINTSHDGVVTILAASRKFEKLGTIETNKTVRSTIAADKYKVLLRTDNELLIIR